MDPTQSGVPTLALRARVLSAQTTMGPAGPARTATGRAGPALTATGRAGPTQTATGRAGALPGG
jgi:hypothetical protein